MLDINLLRGDIAAITKKLETKGYKLDIDKFNNLENERKFLQIKTEELQAKRNSISKQVGILKSKGEDPQSILSQVSNLGEELKAAEFSFTQLQKNIDDLLSGMPNLLDDSVPLGLNETENKEVRKVGVPRSFDFDIKDHVDLGHNLNKQVDFELASKLSGSRFYVLKDKIAKLHRALTQFMLDMHTESHGYTEMYVPYLVNSKTAFGTGQLPKFEEDFFKISQANEDLYLISTAEISLTNFVADSILKEDELPIKMVAHTPCFRSEAGSYGRDTRGMIRVHQFDKVELVQIVKAEDSFSALEELTNHAENILKKLKLPYRVMLLCSGDTGFASAKTYDLEVWIPSQSTYREISSCSCMSDFQGRRMKARVKNSATGKNDFVHTLNGSGLAVGRTLVAILENYQNADGSITVPEALRSYMNCDTIT